MVRKLAWEEVSCTRDAMGVFLRGSLLPEVVSLNMLYMCGFGKLQCLSVGDLDFLSLILLT